MCLRLRRRSCRSCRCCKEWKPAAGSHRLVEAGLAHALVRGRVEHYPREFVAAGRFPAAVPGGSWASCAKSNGLRSLSGSMVVSSLSASASARAFTVISELRYGPRLS